MIAMFPRNYQRPRGSSGCVVACGGLVRGQCAVAVAPWRFCLAVLVYRRHGLPVDLRAFGPVRRRRDGEVDGVGGAGETRLLTIRRVCSPA